MRNAARPGVHERLSASRGAAADEEDDELLPVDAESSRFDDMAFSRRRRSLLSVIFGKRRGILKEGGTVFLPLILSPARAPV